MSWTYRVKVPLPAVHVADDVELVFPRGTVLERLAIRRRSFYVPVSASGKKYLVEEQDLNQKCERVFR